MDYAKDKQGVRNMKVCSRCKRVLPETEFYWDKTGSRFKAECKDCTSVIKRHAYRKKIINKHRESAERRYALDYFCGGVKIYIPYHVKEGEYRFNIVQTGHKIRKINKEAVFLSEIKRILSEIYNYTQKYDSYPLGQKNEE